MVASTQPFFVIILAKIFLYEPCGVVEVVSIFLLFFGVTLVVKPPFLFPEDVLDGRSGKYFYLAVGLLLLGTVAAANVRVILRQLR